MTCRRRRRRHSRRRNPAFDGVYRSLRGERERCAERHGGTRQKSRVLAFRLALRLDCLRRALGANTSCAARTKYFVAFDPESCLDGHVARFEVFDKDQVIDSAVDCFWACGYEAMSVRADDVRGDACMIRFYFHPTPNPAKVALFLEETGLPYEALPVDTSKGEQHKPAFRALNPNSKLPAIVVTYGPGVKESRAC